jgi:hypothetical protein
LTKLGNIRRGKGLTGGALSRLVSIHSTSLSAAEHRRLVLPARARIAIAEALQMEESRLFESNGLAKAAAGRS